MLKIDVMNKLSGQNHKYVCTGKMWSSEDYNRRGRTQISQQKMRLINMCHTILASMLNKQSTVILLLNLTYR